MNEEKGRTPSLSAILDLAQAIAAIAGAVFLVRGHYLVKAQTVELGALAVTGALLMLAVGAMVKYFLTDRRSMFAGLSLSLAWVVIGRAAIDLTGGSVSPIYPLAYLFAALLGAYARPVFAVFALLFFIGLESGEQYYLDSSQAPWDSAAHAAVIIAAAGVVGAFFRSEKKRSKSLEENLAVYQRSRESFDRRAPGDEFKSIREEGRREQLHESIVSLQDALHGVLSDLQEILSAHTVILFTLDRTTGELRFRDAVSESEGVNRAAAIGEGEGILGWVFREKEALRLTDFTHPPENLVYYHHDEKIRSLVAVPVIRETSNEVEGMLVVDSLKEAYFGIEDEKVCWLSARQAMKEIETAETRQRELSEAKVSHALYKVSEILNVSLNMDQVLDATMDCVGKIVEPDFVALAQYDESTRLSSIVRATGDDVFRMKGKTFAPDESLVGWVTSPERYLFYPDFRSRRIQKPMFGKEIPSARNVGTFFCYPLVSGSDFLGSLTLTFADEHALPDYERNAVTTLARMAATSISNANLHERVAKMATTDGLTGLYNHRYFQERLAERVEEARRHPTKHSLILADIDHFKQVNDTHGHPVGDDVLRELAKLFRDSVRNVDLAARYGGEEFVLLLTNTDRKGAMLLAERVRKDAKKLKFEGEGGTFTVSLSLGVATFPDDARTKEQAIEHADEALYYAKEHGRDKAIAYADIRDDESNGPRLAVGRF